VCDLHKSNSSSERAARYSHAHTNEIKLSERRRRIIYGSHNIDLFVARKESTHHWHAMAGLELNRTTKKLGDRSQQKKSTRDKRGAKKNYY
jgi:hypothetical protein